MENNQNMKTKITQLPSLGDFRMRINRFKRNENEMTLHVKT